MNEVRGFGRAVGNDVMPEKQKAEFAEAHRMYADLMARIKNPGPSDQNRIAELEQELARVNQRLSAERIVDVENMTLDDEDRTIIDRLGINDEDYKLLVKKSQTRRGPDNTTDTLRNAFFTTLNAISPRWESAVKDPAFKAFLNAHKDQSSGKPLIVIAQEADAANDAVTVGNLYNSFFAQAQQPARIEPVYPDDKPMLSMKDYEAHSRSVTSGTFRGTREQAEAMTRKYLDAMKEGRMAP